MENLRSTGDPEREARAEAVLQDGIEREPEGGATLPGLGAAPVGAGHGCDSLKPTS
jgi:hypothetical protein